MAKKAHKEKGFSLVEVILAISIFALSVIGLSGGLIYGQQASVTASHRNQAVLYANEGLEASRNIASQDFGNLIDGTFGLIVSDTSYDFSGSYDSPDIFERQLTISSIDANTKQIESRVSWSEGVMDEGEVTLTTYITNWK